jgi:hypothetical protein
LLSLLVRSNVLMSHLLRLILMLLLQQTPLPKTSLLHVLMKRFLIAETS